METQNLRENSAETMRRAWHKQKVGDMTDDNMRGLMNREIRVQSDILKDYWRATKNLDVLDRRRRW